MAWTDWITNNGGGHENSPLYTPMYNGKASLVALEVKEEAGYGIVDLRLHYQDPNSPGNITWTAWACGNPGGQLRYVAITSGKIAVGMTVRVQAGYGVVDLKLHLRNDDYSPSNDAPFSDWACHNPGVEYSQEVPVGPVEQVITGLTVREEAGYGVVDIKLYHVGWS